MEYRPKALAENEDTNVNVTRRRPLRDLLVMLVGALAILVVLYWILGFAVDLLSPYIPLHVEKQMGRLFVLNLCETEDPSESARLQEMLDRLQPALEEEDRRLDYRICVADIPLINAMALPGGQIVVFKGLLDEMPSNDATRFVLAHEMGHFHHRDHLKGLGRSMIILTLSILVLGNDNAATDFLFGTAKGVEMRFSQAQERAADLYALALIGKTHGKCAGALRFMETISGEDDSGELGAYFASHPQPEARFEYLQSAIQRSPHCKQSGQKTD